MIILLLLLLLLLLVTWKHKIAWKKTDFDIK